MSIYSKKEQEDYLFRGNPGRYLHRESEKIAEQYARFNVGALKQIAASAAGAQSVTDLQRLGGGGANKILLLTLDNGKELIARIPLGRKENTEYVITASDVATMEYARTKLGVPVPRVLAWSADRTKTPVGSEFIIMEKASGAEMYKVWDRLDLNQRQLIVDRWIDIEKTLLRATSNGFGSIYFKKNFPPEFHSADLFTDGVKEDDFVVGPHVVRAYWEGERIDFDFDRGPWTDVLSFMTAPARREIAWINKSAKLDAERSSFYPPQFEPRAHVALLDKYLEVIPHLAPTDPRLIRPALVFDDSSRANLFISEEKLEQGEIEISSVIDWSCSSVEPLFLTARWPVFAQRLLPHELPPNSNPDSDELIYRKFDTSPSDYGMSLIHGDNDLHEYYAIACAKKHSQYYQAMSFKYRQLIEMMVTSSGRTWTGDLYAPACLAYTSKHWTDIVPGKPLPDCLRFSKCELSRVRTETRTWRTKTANMAKLRVTLNVRNHDCWVRPSNYAESASLNARLRREYVQKAASEEEKERLERDWPFDADYQEGSTSGISGR